MKPPVKPQLGRARCCPRGRSGPRAQVRRLRAVAFVDGEKVYLQSRGAKPLLRYFPEFVLPKGRYVMDGELVILDDEGREVFDHLQARLHPAESRVKILAEQTPAIFAPSTCSPRARES